MPTRPRLTFIIPPLSLGCAHFSYHIATHNADRRAFGTLRPVPFSSPPMAAPVTPPANESAGFSHPVKQPPRIATPPRHNTAFFIYYLYSTR